MSRIPETQRQTGTASEPHVVASAEGVTFSLLMAAYGAAEHIGPAIQSVLNQTRADWELIVVDDHSPDGLGQCVAPFRTDPRIGYVRLATNGGPAAARNVAAAMARGQYFVIFDADDLLEPNFLERTLRALDAGADLVATCAVRFYEDGVARVQANDPPPLDTSDRERAFLQILRGPFFYNGLTFRRATFEDTGGFNESLRLAEDLDLWLRAAAGGCSVSTIHEPIYRYRVQGSSLSRGGNEQTAAFAASELRILKSLARTIPMTYDRHKALSEHARRPRSSLHLARARLALRSRDRLALRREALRLMRVRPSARAAAMAIGGYLPPAVIEAMERVYVATKARRKTA